MPTEDMDVQSRWSPEELFWLRLGYRVTAELKTSADSNLRWAAIDGFIPDKPPEQMEPGVIRGVAFVLGYAPVELCEMRLVLSVRGQRAYDEARYSDLLPSPEAVGWLTFDKPAKRIHIRL